MSAYANDPRVRQDGPAYFEVGDLEYIVFTNDRATWWTMPATETVSSGHTRGPFGTADEAIHSLIGDPA